MYDNEGYYVVLPDPDTLPEPFFENMTWEEIKIELDQIEHYFWEQWDRIEEDRRWYEENQSWFRDY